VGTEGFVPPPPEGFDTSKRFVRVVERRPDGFVELQFAVGDPSLFVEMILTEAAFRELCESTGAELLPTAVPNGDAAAADDWDWTLHDATHQRFK
jgi:phenol hydroxylase P0 protein